MKHRKSFLWAALVFALAFVPAEAQDALENAAEETQDALENAADETEAALENAADETEDAAREVGDEAEDAAASVDEDDGDFRERLDEATTVLNDFFARAGTDFPEAAIEQAECVAVIPNMREGAFIVGVEYGRGVAICRRSVDEAEASDEGGWSLPSMVAWGGGTVGAQVGGTETDIVLVFRDLEGAQGLFSNEFTFDEEASAVAGSNVFVDEDDNVAIYGMRDGLFAGLSVEGLALRPDRDANEAIYGRPMEAAALLDGDVDDTAPPQAQGFVDAVTRGAE